MLALQYRDVYDLERAIRKMTNRKKLLRTYQWLSNWDVFFLSHQEEWELKKEIALKLNDEVMITDVAVNRNSYNTDRDITDAIKKHVTNPSLLNVIAEKSKSGHYQFIAAKKTGDFDLIKRLIMANDNEFFIMDCFNELPINSMDYNMLKYLKIKVPEGSAYWATVVAKFESAGWQKTIKDKTVCQVCCGEGTRLTGSNNDNYLDNYAQYEYHATCSSCNGTGIISSNIVLRKGEEEMEITILN